MTTLLEPECHDRTATAREQPRGIVSNDRPLPDGRGTVGVLPLAAVLLTFVAASSVTWRQQVTSIEMNRNDAAFYLVLARNLVEHGAYSHQQEPPFAPHTEWPPGVPLLYSVPMSLIGDASWEGGRLWIHGFTLLVSSLALVAVYHFVRQRESVAIAIAVTAVTMASPAFLDSAQAATADTIAVAAAFCGLWMLERWRVLASVSHRVSVMQENSLTPPRRDGTQRKTSHWSVLLVLACVPLIKPYLGMLFPAYLARLFQQTTTAGQRWRGIALLAVCCLPFAGFIGYSIVAAQQSGTISALTWFTTDNPAEIREATNIANAKTAADWLRQSAEAVRFHLVYHTVTAPLPWLAWCGFRDWSWPARLLVFLLIGGLMLLGARQSWRQRDVVSLSYTVSMLAFFVVFACDSARFFTVLTPMCALLFCRGAAWSLNQATRRVSEGECFTEREQSARPRLRFGLHVLLLASAVLATGLWVRHRADATHDPNPFYDDLYAALAVVRGDSTIVELQVPYQLREIARLETGKRVRVTTGMIHHELVPETARLTFCPRDEALRKRYAKFLADDFTVSNGAARATRIWSGPTQQVHLERADTQASGAASAPRLSAAPELTGGLTPNGTRIVSGKALAAGHSSANVDPELPVASAIPLKASAIGLTPPRSPRN